MTGVKFLVFAAIVAVTANAHSWLENPFPRNYEAFTRGGECWRVEGSNEDYVDKNGNKICGKDANGLDILVLKPETWPDEPCLYSRSEGGYNNEFPMSKVYPGQTICLRHPANAHDNDPTRNAPSRDDTYVQFWPGGKHVWWSSVDKPQWNDLHQFGRGIPHEWFDGNLVKIPEDIPLGVQTMVWSWPWTTLDKFHFFTSCIDIEVVPQGQHDELGFANNIVPRDLNLGPNSHCDVTIDPVFTNDGPVFPGSSPMPTPSPTPTTTPSPGATPSPSPTPTPSPSPQSTPTIPKTLSCECVEI